VMKGVRELGVMCREAAGFAADGAILSHVDCHPLTSAEEARAG
jgi:hypothetical protein